MNRKIYLWMVVFAVLCVSIGVLLFTRNWNTEKENELGIPDIPSSFNQAQIEGAMLLKSAIHWYDQHRDKDDLRIYFQELLDFVGKISNMFRFVIIITDENYDVIVDGGANPDDYRNPGILGRDMIINDDNLKDGLLKLYRHLDKSEIDRNLFSELDKFIVSPQDRNDTWLTFYFDMAMKVREVPPEEFMADMMKINFLGVWYDNKFFITVFETRIPYYYRLTKNGNDINNWNDAVKYSDDVLSGVNVDVLPYTSSIDDGKKLVVTVTILDKVQLYKHDSNVFIDRSSQNPENIYLRVFLLTDDGNLVSHYYDFYKLHKIDDKDTWKIEVPVLNDKNYLLEIKTNLKVKIIMNNKPEEGLMPVGVAVYKSIR
ncbi:hypothetical protein F4X73_15255 [Candidatus Poribacteria bacterium]|nr:hypothetical protein [Candidatus Poribacteria bacterium]